MTTLRLLLHVGHRGDGALGYNVLPGDPVSLGLIAAGLLLIAAGLYRLYTHDPAPEPVDESADV